MAKSDKVPMAHSEPTVSMTGDELVIRIPWKVVHVSNRGLRPKRRLTIQDVLEMVEAGRLAHHLGKTRIVRSLKELLA